MQQDRESVSDSVLPQRGGGGDRAAAPGSMPTHGAARGSSQRLHRHDARAARFRAALRGEVLGRRKAPGCQAVSAADSRPAARGLFDAAWVHEFRDHAQE